MRRYGRWISAEAKQAMQRFYEDAIANTIPGVSTELLEQRPQPLHELQERPEVGEDAFGVCHLIPLVAV